MVPTTNVTVNLPLEVSAVIIGLVMLILDWFGGVATVGWGWAIVIGIIGTIFVIIGLWKFVFGYR